VTTPEEPLRGGSASDANEGSDAAKDSAGPEQPVDPEQRVDPEHTAIAGGPDGGPDGDTASESPAAGSPDGDTASESPADAENPQIPAAPEHPADAGDPIDSANPAEQDVPADQDAPTAPARPEPPIAAQLPAPARRFSWVKAVAISTAVLVLAVAGVAWYAYQHLSGNITTDTTAETELKAQESQRPSEAPTSAENILLIGSDSRSDGNDKYGPDSGTQRSDTTILLHLSADRSNATAVSIPRDLMTHVPECTKADGSHVSATFEQFNWAFQFGGAACTIRAVEQLTGVRIDHHLTVDFSGFKNMVNAVGGVDVCVPEPVHDRDAHLDLPAGRQKLNGEQALGYVRLRHSVGDGSDTERIGRQQDFLASLVKKVQSNGVLLNPTKVYPLLNAATKSLTADPGLNSLSELYKLAQSLQKIPAGQIHFVTTPVEQYVADHDRDQLVQPDADRLFAAVHDDQPVRVSADGSSAGSGTGTGTGTKAPTNSPSAGQDPSGTATQTPSNTPTYKGTTADRKLCGTD
jgi:LCP family protein required for cell wall assembly